MQTIGERLEEARKRKGISVREAAETTKIRGDYLQKFEANTFEIDLPPLYIRGFLRSYARYLELDPERIVNDYNELLSEGKPTTRREAREGYGRVDFAETARAKEPSEPAPANRAAQDQAMLLKFGLLGGGAIIVVVLVILLFKVIFSGSPSKPSQPAQQAVQQNAVAAQTDPVQTLTLTATDPTRVKVVQDSDGTILFNAALARGESKTIKKQGKLLITVESGKNLRMEVNGRNYTVPVDSYGRFGLD
jgi:cytoskeletal protein RodZ